MSIVRLRPPTPGSLRARLLEGAKVALARLNFNEAFRRRALQRFAELIDSAEFVESVVDYSEWPEFLALDASTVRAAEPLLRRMADAVAAEAFAAFSTQILFPEVVCTLHTQLPDDGGKAA